ncbi:hypothetical protein IH980_04670 [Patescibacteria group bacterium]|nr:hypothetical protein [Patescibacteria group bacterium]
MVIENISLTLFNALAFSVYGLVFWLLPGNHLLSQKTKLPTLNRLFLATAFGFALYAAIMFLVRLVGLPFWVGLAPMILLAFKEAKTLWKRRRYKTQKPTSAQKIFLAIAIVGMLLQALVLVRSGIRTPDGMKFTELSFHDSIWHIYLINELKENFPPRHGGFAPVTIKNYHFLLDLTIASITKYLPLSTFELYYRIVPSFVSLLASLGIFVLARELTKSEKTANVAVFLSLFAGNASWFVKFFRGEEFQFSANTFMLDPFIDLLQNPHAVVVFPLMIAGILGLMMIEKKKSLRISFLTATAFGVMIGFKAWGGTLMLISLPIAAAWMSLTKKRHDFWLVWLATLFLSLVVFLPIYDPKTAAGLVFIPGWLLKRMVEDPDRYNMPKYYFLEQHYREKGNILRLIQINLTEVLIYVFGNLWLRALGIFTAITLVAKKVKPSELFILVVITASLSLPLLFNQGRMAYDIIQFGPYGLLLLAILTAPMMMKLSSLFPVGWQTAVIVLMLLLSVPSNSPSIIGRASDEAFIVTNSELDAYEYLREQTSKESRLLLYPSRQNISTAKVAALSHRPTYFSAETFSRITGEDFEGRRQELITFFSTVDPVQRNRVLETPINYIVLTKEEDKEFNKAAINLSKAFVNDEIVIYKVN